MGSLPTSPSCRPNIDQYSNQTWALHDGVKAAQSWAHPVNLKQFIVFPFYAVFGGLFSLEEIILSFHLLSVLSTQYKFQPKHLANNLNPMRSEASRSVSTRWPPSPRPWLSDLGLTARAQLPPGGSLHPSATPHFPLSVLFLSVYFLVLLTGTLW